MTALLTAILGFFSPPAQAPEPLTLEAIIQGGTDPTTRRIVWKRV